MHTNLHKETVAVLFGGRSAEHEVSVITGHQVMDALEAAGYRLLPIYIGKMGAWYAGQPLHNIKLYTDSALNPDKLQDVYRVSLSPDRTVRRLLPHPDRRRRLFQRVPCLWADVFFPTMHGNFGEDGALQGLFEMADVAYVGSGILASAVGMDKVRMKALCRDADIPVLDCVSIARAEWQRDSDAFVTRVEAFSDYPLMVKPVCLGSSIGVRRCDNATELRDAIDVAVVLDDRILVEPALTDFFEVNCAVLGPPVQASVCEQPHRSETVLSFDAKYKQGRKGAKGSGRKGGMASLGRTVPAPISEALTSHVQELAVKAFQGIGAAGVARTDFLLKGEKVYFNEINTLPGSLAFYLWEANGVAFDELVSRAVDIALAQYQIRSATQFAFDANLLQSG
ncbi:MAG: D-alanine--D-alanine ligase [bacterium]|nr:D-alanine--D-alanine ligase [bacterium]